MKKFSIMALIIISLCATVLPIMSVSASTQLEAQAIPLRVLGISAPDAMFVGQPVPIKVYDQMTNRPVSWAGVWALDLDGMQDGQDLSLLADMARDSGDFLGWTNENGYIIPYPRFIDTGMYLLVAMKQGWNPAFITMEVKPLVPMGIKAPEEVFVGQPIPIYVFDRDNGSPIDQARVWAIDLTVASDIPEDADACAELAESHSIYLGSTNESGYIIPYPRLIDPGRYVLLPLKPWHTPAYTKLSVKPLGDMGIKAPDIVTVGRPVPIKVYDQDNGNPIYRAGVWAVDLASISEVTSDNVAVAEVAQNSGLFLGWTNRDGYVNPYPRFKDPGKYALVVLKYGYNPAVKMIKVVQLQPAVAEKLTAIR
ncbi:hypothetical protein ACFLYL_04015 [Chloroflexota bacterium]